MTGAVVRRPRTIRQVLARAVLKGVPLGEALKWALSIRRSTALGPTVIRSVIASSAIRLGGLLLGFVVAIQLARGLGSAGYGIYGLAMSIIAVLAVLADLGSARTVTREVAAAQVNRNWALLRGVVIWARLTALMISIPVAIGVWAWAWSTPQPSSALSATLAAGILLVPLMVFVNVQGGVLRGLQYIVQGQLPDALLRPAFFAILLLAALWSQPRLTPQLAIALGSFSIALALIVGAVLLKRAMPKEAQHVAPTILYREWLAGSLPVVYAEAVRVLQTHSVILILGLMVSSAVVGEYRAASSLLVLFAAADTMFNIIGAPIISRLYFQGDIHRLRRLVTGLAAASALGTLILVAPFLIWRQHLVVLLLGNQFSGSTAPLLILAAAFALGTAVGPGAVLLNMTGRQRDVAHAASVSLILLPPFSVPLIHWYGAEGAAMAYTISLLSSKAVTWHRCRKSLDIDPSVLGLLRLSATRSHQE